MEVRVKPAVSVLVAVLLLSVAVWLCFWWAAAAFGLPGLQLGERGSVVVVGLNTLLVLAVQRLWAWHRGVSGPEKPDTNTQKGV